MLIHACVRTCGCVCLWAREKRAVVTKFRWNQHIPVYNILQFMGKHRKYDTWHHIWYRYDDVRLKPFHPIYQLIIGSLTTWRQKTGIFCNGIELARVSHSELSTKIVERSTSSWFIGYSVWCWSDASHVVTYCELFLVVNFPDHVPCIFGFVFGANNQRN